MSIVGHGIDIVETERIGRMLQEHGRRFLDRCFTPREQAYCAANSRRRVEHLAGRFAAKEAVFKALGTGWRGGIAWTDVEILRRDSGQPYLQLSGECLRVAERLGIRRWQVSITHVSTHAAASAIALGG
jgi:holo-[acyl-carrier protein] synthase